MKAVILEKVNNDLYLWKVFQYFPTEKEIEKVLEKEKELFPKKTFKFSLEEITF